MSGSAVPAPVPAPVPDETLEKAQRLARWSLLMLVMLIPAALIAAIFGVYMLGRRDLEGSEPMSVQGAYGWMVWAISTIILLAPVAVGLVLGLKARRLGAKRLGLVGSLIDGAILIGYPIMSVMGLLRQGSG